MPQFKELVAQTAPAAADLVAIQQDSDDASKKVTLQNLIDTLMSSVVSAVVGGVEEITIVSGSPNTLTFDADNGNTFYCTAASNFTFNAPATAARDGQKVVIIIKQDGTGSRIWTSGTNLRFGDDVTGVTLDTDANHNTYITLIYNPIDSVWDVVAVVKGYDGT